MTKPQSGTLYLAAPLLPLAETTRTIWQADASEICLPDDTNTLAAIFAAAPHLRTTALHFDADALHHAIGAPKPAIEAALAHWELETKNFTSDEAFMPAVRVLRAKIWFIIAVGELSGSLSMQECYYYLSLTAERVLVQTVKWICAQTSALSSALDITQVLGGADSLDGSGYMVLALGKLGAGELNYSSDLDLIILHDSQTTGIDRSVFIAMTRRLVHLLSAQTKDGFAFRVDLRLRPDPGATSISIEHSAALTYYESQARTWERSAYIRARPIAGDISAASQFLDELQPFIWRRYLDYTVIEDLQMWLQKKPTPDNMFGFDVKNGAFGIRHIELLTHSLQLLNGGRHKTLRTYSTHLALDNLASLGLISADQAQDLQSLYDAWRQLEHRLQYQRDAHLYRLPLEDEEFSIFARFAGFETSDDLRAHISQLQHKTDVAAHHPVLSKLLETQPAEPNKAQAPATTNWMETAEMRLDWLAAQGFTGPETINQTIEGWLSGRIAATRGSRSQHYLLKLLPNLLEQLAASDAADEAFAAFADIIAGQPAGAQIFALLDFHPKLVGLLLDILTCAPQLADQIRRHPDVMELLLDPGFYANLPETALTIDTEMPVEIQLDQIRRQVRRIQFGISIHQLQNLSSTQDIAVAWTELARQATMIITQLAKDDMIRRHGRIDADLALLALGSFGAETMSAHSDLDLVAIYNGDMHIKSEGQLDGKRAIGLSAYMVRLTQTIVSWLTIQTAEGALYNVDMRLRPDGNAGPLAVHIDRVAAYYKDEAWSWEQLALGQAHLVAGEAPFIDTAAEQISKLQELSSSPAQLAADLIKMRALLHEEHKSDKGETPWQLKRIPGGKLDCNLLTQLMNSRADITLSAEAKDALHRIEYVSRWLQVGLGHNLATDTLPNRMGQLLAKHLAMSDQWAVRTQLQSDAHILAAEMDQILTSDLNS